jgi:hypothetical protein
MWWIAPIGVAILVLTPEGGILAILGAAALLIVALLLS